MALDKLSLEKSFVSFLFDVNASIVPSYLLRCHEF